MNDPAELAALVADATGIPEHMRAEPAAEVLRCLDHSDPAHCTGPVVRHDALTSSGVRYPRCDAAWADRLAQQRRMDRDYPNQDTPPAWYTAQGGEAYAGERWDEDD